MPHAGRAAPAFVALCCVLACEGKTEDRTDARADDPRDAQADARTGGRTDARTDTDVDAQTGGRTDARTAAQTDALACEVVVPSDYDTSCMGDSDCAEVGQVSACPASACDGCNLSAVSNGAAAAYKSALTRALASIPMGQECSCPCDGGFAVCRAGKCEAAFCGPPVSDTLPSCENALGTCQYSRNTTCTQGAANACAYADEVCCVE